MSENTLNRIALRNFRSFRGTLAENGDQTLPVEVELAPITFLIGRNGIGKSSILKALSLLSDYFDSRDQRLLYYNGPNAGKHKLGGFDNTINKDCDKSEGFLIGIGKGGYLFEFQFINVEDVGPVLKQIDVKDAESEAEVVRLSLDFVDFENLTWSMNLAKSSIWGYSQEAYDRNREELLTRLKVLEKQLAEADRRIDELQNEGDPGKLPEALNRKDALEHELNQEKKNLSLLEKRSPKGVARIKFSQSEIRKASVMDTEELSEQQSASQRILQAGFDVQEIAFEMMRQFLWQEKSPRYALKERQYPELDWAFEAVHIPSNRVSFTRVNMNSDDTASINRKILDLPGSAFPMGGKADTFLKTWMSEEHFNIGGAYRFCNVEGAVSYIQIHPEKNPASADDGWMNLIDKGYGLVQVFNVLLYIAYEIYRQQRLGEQESETGGMERRKPVTILIEEPESNLHPAFQSKLADLFIEVHESYGFHFVVETHSEYLVRRTQVLVKGLKAANPDASIPFKVQYIDGRGPNRVREIRYRKDGIFENTFGKGFFDEATDLSIELYHKT